MKKIILVVAILVVCITTAVAHFTLKPKYESLTAQEFAALIDSVDVVLVDVRTPTEHDSGHIPGTAFNIDVKSDSFLLESQISLKKDRAVAIYCRSGNRSKNAARILAEKGYQVLELGTGFRGWVASGKETVK